jgi:hypothetical protein
VKTRQPLVAVGMSLVYSDSLGSERIVKPDAGFGIGQIEGF